jgi:hypothetical protein
MRGCALGCLVFWAVVRAQPFFTAVPVRVYGQSTTSLLVQPQPPTAATVNNPISLFTSDALNLRCLVDTGNNRLLLFHV